MNDRFSEALRLALQFHRGQFRKDSRIPYVSHPLAVASLVLENGADEDTAIAALLHDAAEDAGGEDALRRIEARFGSRVASLVRDCSDSLTMPKPPWRQRKEEHLERLRSAPPDVLLITLADKIHNLRCIIADVERLGAVVWRRFRGGQNGTLWYYRAVLQMIRSRQVHAFLTRRLASLVRQLEDLAQRTDVSKSLQTPPQAFRARQHASGELRSDPFGAVSVIGIPFDRNSSHRRGPALAPGRIRETLFSGAMNLTSESGHHIGSKKGWRDLGDLLFGREEGLEPKLRDAIDPLFEKGERVFALGGDHSITYPLVQSLARHVQPLAILHLDAHPDLYDRLDGNPLSHGSPFARIMEEGLVSRLVQVGIRAINQHQELQARRFGVEVVPMNRWDSSRIFRFREPVYLSVDLDCLDPAFAPGVSHHEPGGLTTREVLTMIQKFRGRLVGADLVEFNPEKDVGGTTHAVAAKLFKEILARLLEDSSAMPGEEGSGG